MTLTWTSDVPQAGSGVVTLYRPSGSALDRSVPIQPDADGRQIVALEGLAAGHWRLQLQWQIRGRDFYTERTVVVP